MIYNLHRNTAHMSSCPDRPVCLFCKQPQLSSLPLLCTPSCTIVWVLVEVIREQRPAHTICGRSFQNPATPLACAPGLCTPRRVYRRQLASHGNRKSMRTDTCKSCVCSVKNDGHGKTHVFIYFWKWAGFILNTCCIPLRVCRAQYNLMAALKVNSDLKLLNVRVQKCIWSVCCCQCSHWGHCWAVNRGRAVQTLAYLETHSLNVAL